ncbi:MAG: hypothetical protein HQL21_03835 [Candidatus Omnitrophica bacterium]|nr:hypothetical protein [Candidatus Omnitrophota bacterium]
MKDVLRRIFPGFFFFLFLSLFSQEAFSQDLPIQSSHKILLIHSYHSEYSWVKDITRGVQAALNEQEVSLDIFYMDTKRYTSQEWMVEMGKKAREKISEVKPDVVIVSDDNAQAFVTRHYLNKRPFFVFCGVNGDPEDYGFPADNVSGVLERPFINQSLALLREIVPSVKNIAVMSDSGETSVGALRHIEENIKNIIVKDYKIVEVFSLWKKRIMEFNHKVDALVFYTYHTIKKASNLPSLAPGEVMDWTRENIKIPSVGLLDFAIQDGVLCGVVESGYEHGFEAGQIALRIIGGEKPTGIPIKTAEKGISMVNLKTARALGITISDEVLKLVDVVIDEK